MLELGQNLSFVNPCWFRTPVYNELQDAKVAHLHAIMETSLSKQEGTQSTQGIAAH